MSHRSVVTLPRISAVGPKVTGKASTVIACRNCAITGGAGRRVGIPYPILPAGGTSEQALRSGSFATTEFSVAAAHRFTLMHVDGRARAVEGVDC